MFNAPDAAVAAAQAAFASGVLSSGTGGAGLSEEPLRVVAEVAGSGTTPPLPTPAGADDKSFPTKLSAAFEGCGLAPQLAAGFLSSMGATADDNPSEVLELTDEEIGSYVAVMKIKVDNPAEGQPAERDASGMEVARVKGFIRKLRALATPPPSAPPLQQPQPSGNSAPQKLVVEVADTSSKLKFCDFLDQSLGG